jgi:hypothetical protein
VIDHDPETGDFHTVAFRRDGRRLAASGDDGAMRIRNATLK